MKVKREVRYNNVIFNHSLICASMCLKTFDKTNNLIYMWCVTLLDVSFFFNFIIFSSQCSVDIVRSHSLFCEIVFLFWFITAIRMTTIQLTDMSANPRLPPGVVTCKTLKHYFIIKDMVTINSNKQFSSMFILKHVSTSTPKSNQHFKCEMTRLLSNVCGRW